MSAIAVMTVAAAGCTALSWCPFRFLGLAQIPLVSARSAATKVVKSVPEEVEADRHIA